MHQCTWMLNQTCFNHSVSHTSHAFSSPQAIRTTMPNARCGNAVCLRMTWTVNHNTSVQNYNHATHDMLRQSSNIFDMPLHYFRMSCWKQHLWKVWVVVIETLWTHNSVTTQLRTIGHKVEHLMHVVHTSTFIHWLRCASILTFSQPHPLMGMLGFVTVIMVTHKILAWHSQPFSSMLWDGDPRFSQSSKAPLSISSKLQCSSTNQPAPWTNQMVH